jgi:hypothetical protein
MTWGEINETPGFSIHQLEVHRQHAIQRLPVTVRPKKTQYIPKFALNYNPNSNCLSIDSLQCKDGKVVNNATAKEVSVNATDFSPRRPKLLYRYKDTIQITRVWPRREVTALNEKEKIALFQKKRGGI